jgi:hypothetical protein
MRARILREPLFAFLVTGILLFVVYAWLRQPEPVVLQRATRDALLVEFETLAGRKPSAADIERIEREYVADELLFRAAIQEGAHLGSPAVRRQLIEEMRLRVAGLPPDPTVDDLLDHYSDHLERYRSEPSASFEQVYFSAPPANAAGILERLNRDEPVAGDPFRHGRVFEKYGRSMVRGMFGQGFTNCVWSAAQGQWTGPVESSQGWHFVRVDGLQPAALRPFPEVSNQVENDWLAAQIQAAVDRKVAELARGQRITVER